MKIDREFETILGLDVGAARIGVARAHKVALFPQPLVTLEDPSKFLDDILRICADERAGMVVVGRPRGMAGQETAQTKAVEEFGKKLEESLNVPVYWNDEAVTSVAAEAELKNRGKPYTRADIDALAAVYILDDFIKEHAELMNV